MKISRKILFITISVLLTSFLISSTALVLSFKKNYTQALLSGSYGLGYSLHSIVEELLSLGLPLDSLAGLDTKCRQILQRNHHITYVGVSDTTGKILYNGDPSLNGKVFTDPTMRRSIASAGPVTQIYRRFDGHEYYDVSIPIYDSAQIRLGQVRLGFPTRVVSEKVQTALLQVVVNFSISFLVIAFLINYFISRFVSRPVIRISQHAQKIAEGDYDAKLEVTHGDEVGALAASINEMSSQVKQKTHDLEIANEDLAVKLVERDAAVESLKSSESKFRSFVDHSFDVIFVLDAQGVFQFVSRSWEQHFGYPASEVIGQEFAPCVHPDDVAPCFEYLSQILSTGEGGTSPAYRVRCADGSWRLFMANGTLYRDASGRVLYLGIGHDITDQRKAEEERLSLERQLLHAQKLESLGVLAGGIAHDFNNLLMAILGNADLALMRIGNDSPGAENLRKIEQASARAADLAKQMLAYSGKGKFLVEKIDLNQLLKDMVSMLEVSVSKKAALRLNLHDPIPAIEADITQIRQVVMNLVINASEAIGEVNGVITLTTGSLDCDQNYLKGVWLNDHIRAGRYVCLEVTDTGCGMDKETMGKIFDPFFTTKFTGRGLGMAAVLGIVRGHNGGINVYSEPGKGSMFKILLPAAGALQPPTATEQALKEWRGGGTVLLVDDEETVLDIASEMLQELGFDVVTARDGNEALALFRERSSKIVLVLLDLTMPHLDGEQCFHELRRIVPEVQVVMSSGYTEQEITRKFAGKGLAGFIQKPYTLKSLREVLVKVVTGEKG
ncbi:PAS domain S-box protein [Geomesophilobacter sediminis]|uniref:histidine kinase n=1 Tax=Geomesophilobacter sediminis TaxID=2798584 RepID=A0A8J7LYP0_9BACT|nr:PAS domain S-box protein [Geomesophilobacter sediminis]MBJ6725182.1 PAS domain S-box protein [Geomesophilobacter sediminis]